MKKISADDIRKAVSELSVKANYTLGCDVTDSIQKMSSLESDERARYILNKIQENIKIAAEDDIPLCQDTGLACVFVEMGQDVCIEGGYLYDAINDGVRNGYKEGYLRKSVVKDPLKRENTGDNTPAHIHVDIVPGDTLKLTVAPKGFGSENMSRVAMLTPAAGEDGVKDFIVETVKIAGGKPCPPVVIGVGIGGTFDLAPLNAKKALLLPIDHVNEDPYYAEMERELLKRINRLDIGPQGFGGDTTALGVNIIKAPTHIAGLPVAVNVNCHVSRHASIVL